MQPADELQAMTDIWRVREIERGKHSVAQAT